jgi:large subunit ribosomal protein L4
VIPTTNVGVADLVGAANVLVTQAALDELTARAKGEKTTTAEEASA